MTTDLASLVTRLRLVFSCADDSDAATIVEAATAIEQLQSRITSLESARDMARAGALREAAEAQPCTAADPNESDYQRGKFDGIMEYATAIRALLGER